MIFRQRKTRSHLARIAYQFSLLYTKPLFLSLPKAFHCVTSALINAVIMLKASALVATEHYTFNHPYKTKLMARVTDEFVSGTLGNVVLYRRMDTNCARIKRGSINQTPATKLRSTNFGIASRAASPLRKGLRAVIPFPTDRSMQSRFSGSVAKWLCRSEIDSITPCEEIGFVTGFQFTPDNSLDARFKVPCTVSQPQDDLIMVSVDNFVPIENVSAPAGTLMIELVVSVASCTIADGIASGSITRRIQAPYNNQEIPSQVLSFNIPTTRGSLIVTGAWLQYYVMNNNRITRTANRSFMPSGVLNARYV